MASRPFPRESPLSRPPSSSSLSASVQMGSSPAPSPSPSTSPPMPMIGRAGNLTVFITPPSPASTPRSSRPSDSPRPDFSTPNSRTGTAPPPPQKSASPPAPPVKFSSPPPPVKVSLPPVQVPPPQYGKASAGGKHDGSAFGFLWDAVARVQEAHTSLDEYVANWFGLDQSKYQWALNDYYDTTGKEVEYGKAGKPKELTTTTTTTTTKVQKV
ncbi:leucine-rich repeat extensin-like protein 3 [Triticum urartu]|nr:leucine-rich repeat extensin-like protein 3 [Triticum urartu]XP_048555933.1 leucine-rich repeat extensin-like protein 3 [Triticum urartu]XP_048555934.1 leucine-rich repeat extensin-like protein 3 [Triticum urartu]XP_048555935.1 leucine-rich repeat extensin-like protein 3 [Triticum urartu]XP_048555936.1 leucine-rich repeat extensin-like protein 3 [Triticum urartu]XP_048555937.1 leucine-rich repeat extensin-like protein 3 [Triticum urartu]